jgi:probable HAF family extracellular repeat protein
MELQMKTFQFRTKVLPTKARWKSYLAVPAAILIVLSNPPSLHAGADAAPGYVIEEYGRLNDYGTTAVVRRINSYKEIAGGFKRGSDLRKLSKAFVLKESGFEDLRGDAGTDFSTSYGLNDNGEVVGALNTTTSMRPFRATRGSSFRILPLLSGDNGGIAYSINENGEAVGFSSGKTGVRPVWWTVDGNVNALQGLAGNFNYALDLNDSGDIVGVSGEALKEAVLWPDKGAAVALGTLPGFIGSEAVSINNQNEIVGFATGTNANPNLSRAVLWKPLMHSIQDIGTLPGGSESRARDINDRGEVVGTSTSSHGNRAFIWTAAEGMLDLNTLFVLPGVVVTDAMGINKTGDIVVIGHMQETASADPAGGHDHGDHEQPRQIFVLTRVQ